MSSSARCLPRRPLAAPLGLAFALAVASLTATEDDGARLFTLRVAPVLEERCLGCHGRKPERLRGELDVRSLAALTRGGESGRAAVVPGEPDESLLLHAVGWTDPDLRMPPKENDRLSAAEVEDIRRWIAAGAPWPTDAERERIRLEASAAVENEHGVIVRTSGGLSEDWNLRRYDPEAVWAFRPLSDARPPRDDASPIDAFIFSRIEAAGLQPAPEADPATLLRRVTYDLTGLPPTPEERAAFFAARERDPEAAWRELVDRLLASPHYGERQAQHWLDVVRYADTGGFSNDYERSNLWRYRDWVIRAFSEDKPYDEFVVEQIAGDELESPRSDQIVATGFLRLGPWGTAMIPQEEARQLLIEDMAQSVGHAFLSIPLRCARCHDHKFDPIPTRDYYRLYAAFAATRPAEVPAEFTPRENRAGFDAGRRLVDALFDYADRDRRRILDKQESAARAWYAERGKPYKTPQERKSDADADKPPRHVGLDPVDEGTLKVREQDCWIWDRRRERYEPLAQSVYSGPPTWLDARKLRRPERIDASWRPQTFIHLGGAATARGEAVGPGVLSAVPLATSAASEADPWALPDELGGRRLALARWVTHPENPLSTRSIVNRIWQHHFGRGIVRTANNFGSKGARPTHPELLDWLARDFVRGGWRLKRLHRQIVLSRAYRLSGEPPDRDALDRVDPRNDLLSWFSPRLLSAEEIRDSLLAVSGELCRDLGGLPVRPEIHLEVALEPRMIQFSIAPAYQPSRTPRERNRRAIYAYRVRGQADPFLEVLNRPGPNDSCALRETAATTPQVFTLLNSDVMTDRSIAFALRLEREVDDDDARIRRAFELAHGRAATVEEQQLLSGYLGEMRSYHEANPPERRELAKTITRSLVEEFSGQPFEYVEWLAGYEDYVPDAKPWSVDASTRALADVCLLLFNSNEFLYVY